MGRFFMVFSRKYFVFQHPVSSGRFYSLPQKGDATCDFSKISGDMKMIGRDLKYSVNCALPHHG